MYLAMKEDEFPVVSAALIKKLDNLVPERSADSSETMQEIMHYGGKRALVRFLMSIHEEQTSRGA